VLSTYVSLHSEFPSCDVRNDFNIKTMLGSSFPPVVCRRVHVKFTLFVIVCYSGVPQILCCVYDLFFFVYVASVS